MKKLQLLSAIVFCFIIFSIQQISAQDNWYDFKTPSNASPEDSVKLKEYANKLKDFGLTFNGGLFIDSILSIAPNNGQLCQRRALQLFRQKKYELALPYLDQAVKYDAHEWLDYRAFMECIFSKKYSKAIEDFNNARIICKRSIVQEHPYDFYVGLCYLQMNKLDSAELYFTKTIDDERKYKSSESWINYLHWFYLGVVHFERDDFKQSLFYFEKCLKLYPNFSDAKYYKAICIMRDNKIIDAYEAMYDAKIDSDKGFTFTDDSATDETYPYQVSKYSFSSTLDFWKKYLPK